MTAGFDHTMLLLSDGIAVSCGSNMHSQCDLPGAVDGLRFTQLAAGSEYPSFVESRSHATADFESTSRGAIYHNRPWFDEKCEK